MLDDLSQAIDACNLPDLINEKYSQAGSHQGAYQHATKARLSAVWRDSSSVTVAVTQNGTRWLWHDKATDEGGNAMDFLTVICGMDKRAAANELKNRAGIVTHKPRTVQDRLQSEFIREHPNADPSFFIDWLEMRGNSNPTAPTVSPLPFYAPDSPSFPLSVTQRVIQNMVDADSERLESSPQFKTLAHWIADSITHEIEQLDGRLKRAILAKQGRRT